MLYVASSIPAAVVAVTAATVLGANPKKVRPRDWVRFTIATFCVGWLVGASFYTLLSFLASVLSVKNTWLWVTTNVAGLTLIIFLGAWYVLFRQHLLWALLGAVFLIAALLDFGKTVYPAFPHHLGGGGPHYVHLLIEAKKARVVSPLGVKPASGQTAAKPDSYLMTEPVILLASSKDSYVFAVVLPDRPKADEPTGSLVLKRADIAGLVYR